MSEYTRRNRRQQHEQIVETSEVVEAEVVPEPAPIPAPAPQPPPPVKPTVGELWVRYQELARATTKAHTTGDLRYAELIKAKREAFKVWYAVDLAILKSKKRPKPAEVLPPMPQLIPPATPVDYLP